MLPGYMPHLLEVMRNGQGSALSIPTLIERANLEPELFIDALEGLVGRKIVSIDNIQALNELRSFVTEICSDARTAVSERKRGFFDHASRPESFSQKAQVIMIKRGIFF